MEVMIQPVTISIQALYLDRHGCQSKGGLLIFMKLKVS